VTSVIIVQTILPHYRASFFERLAGLDELDVKVVAGEGQEVATFSSSGSHIQTILENKKISIKGHTFVYQKGLISLLLREKPDHVVFGGPDIHVLSTFWAFFVLKLLTRTNIHWWTHGINKKSNLLRTFQEFFLARSSSAMTYESDGQREILTALNWSSEKVTVLKNAINTKDYGLLLDNKKNNIGSFCILFAGRLTLAKRCDILIKSAKELKDAGLSFKVEIIGEGPDLNTCKSLVDTLQLNDYVIFHGAKYDDELSAIFSRADIFVLPGKVGLSALHALSYGLPVLTTDQDIHSPEIALIEKGHNGDFFQGFSEESLAIKIQEWMKIIEEDNEHIRSRVKKTVQLAGYTPEAMVKNFVKHFKNLK